VAVAVDDEETASAKGLLPELALVAFALDGWLDGSELGPAGR
jgi:hypothetical protein